MNNFQDKMTPDNVALLSKTLLAKITDSQQAFGMCVALMRLSPENIKTPYTQREFLQGKLLPEHIKLFKYGTFAVAYDNTGRAIPMGDGEKKDNFYDFVTGNTVATSPWETIVDMHETYILGPFSDLENHSFQRAYKVFFRTLTEAMIIELRALDCLRYTGKLRMGKTEIAVSKINPMARDLWTIPQILGSSVNAAQKGPLTLFAEWYNASKENDEGSRNYAEILRSVLDGKMGRDTMQLVSGFGSIDMMMRTMSKLTVVARCNHTPVVHPDLKTLGDILREGLAGQAALLRWVTKCSSNVLGFLFEDGVAASKMKLLCSTGEIYSGSALGKIERLSKLKFEKGVQKTMAETTQTSSMYVTSTFSSQAGKGAEAGYNPGGGRNCSDSVFARVSESVKRTVDEQGPQQLAVFTDMQRREKAQLDSTIPVINSDGTIGKVPCQWDVFFHTRQDGDPTPPPRKGNEERGGRPKGRQQQSSRFQSRKQGGGKARQYKPYSTQRPSFYGGDERMEYH